MFDFRMNFYLFLSIWDYYVLEIILGGTRLVGDDRTSKFSFLLAPPAYRAMAAASSYTTQDITSLRAAALLTLRSRPKSRRLPRRTSLEKPDDTSSIASTRKAPASPELDYGSDDASENGNNPQIQTEQEEEAGEKEEGEISDDETRRIAQPSSSGMDIDSEPLSDPNSIPNRDTNVATSVLNEIKQPFGPVEPSPFTSGLSPGSIAPGPMDAEERSVQGPFISGSIPASSHLFQSPYPRMGSMNTPPGLSYVNAEYVRPSLKSKTLI